MANTAIKGLNLDAIRELNKIKVYAVKNVTHEVNLDPYTKESFTETESKPLFTAYLTSPLGAFNSQINTDSLTQSMGEFIKQSKLVSLAGETMIGGIIQNLTNEKGKYAAIGNFLGTGTELSSVLNYNFNYRFTGTNEFTHSFQCELVVKDDFFEDVINPLWDLLSYVLPDETSRLEESDVYNAAKAWVQDKYSDTKNYLNDKTSNFIEPDALNWIWEKIETYGGTADNMLGGITIMTKPKQLQADNLFTRIVIGNYIVIDNVIIDNVSFNLPYLFYEGGLFDKVTITLNVKGNRKMSLKTYDWLRQLKESRESVGDSSNWKRTQKDTLNALYNSDNQKNLAVLEERRKQEQTRLDEKIKAKTGS